MGRQFCQVTQVMQLSSRLGLESECKSHCAFWQNKILFAKCILIFHRAMKRVSAGYNVKRDRVPAGVFLIYSMAGKGELDDAYAACAERRTLRNSLDLVRLGIWNFD